MAVPAGIQDLGLVAVSLFLFTASLWIIMKIIQTFKKPAEATNGNGARLRPGYCLQSPELQVIRTNQALTLQAVQKIEEGGDEIKQNMILQTKLMEQMGHILQKLSDCAIKAEAISDSRRKSQT
jgi:hypothetical protein